MPASIAMPEIPGERHAARKLAVLDELLVGDGPERGTDMRQLLASTQKGCGDGTMSPFQEGLKRAAEIASKHARFCEEWRHKDIAQGKSDEFNAGRVDASDYVAMMLRTEAGVKDPQRSSRRQVGAPPRSPEQRRLKAVALIEAALKELSEVGVETEGGGNG